MSRLANANKRSRVIRALRRAGFGVVPGGKHMLVTDASGHYLAAIPNARELNPTTLRAILKQCGLTERQYLALY